MNIVANNHYVSCAYLERFSSSGSLYRYRTLVEHEKVHTWKPCSPRGLAYFKHLYTSVEAGLESDHIEKWLAREIEEPANMVIGKVLAGTQLSPKDWTYLIRYVAAQDVRTPTSLLRCIAAYNSIMPKVLEHALNDLSGTRDLSSIGTEDASDTTNMPFPLRIDIEGSNGTTTVQATGLVGRSLWLYEMDRRLTSIWHILEKHRWTILRAPNQVQWFTSDDPVIKLRTDADGNYDFGGGWDSPSTQIFMPLDTNHILYASCGKKPPTRGHTLNFQQAEFVRKLIAEHAYREIYTRYKVPDISLLRPRIVDSEVFNAERNAKQQFHESQTSAEWEMLTRPVECTK